MTLIELLKQIRGIESRMLTTEGIPLKMYGKNCQVKLELYGDNGNYWVEVRSNIDYDEKVAIIMQMFEDGTNGIQQASCRRLIRLVKVNISLLMIWMVMLFLHFIQGREGGVMMMEGII